MPIFHADRFYSVLYHPVFLSAFFSWFIAQLIKSIIEIFKKRSRSSKDILKTLLWTTGGMPSSHSALVTALATSIGFEEGITSPLFIVTLFYGLLTVRDALGVRRAAGSQAKIINQLTRELNQRFGIDFRPVKEIHGHTMAEVSVGILLGFFIALAFNSL
ncbi:MAG: divergent PAP2 family protein [Spirochaetota bacterium]